MSKISVIIPVYNALEDLKVLVESLKNNFNFSLGKIILINDCSKKETTDYLINLNKENPQFNICHNEQNLGFIKTCNKGMKIAKGEIIVLLNSDTQIPKLFAEKIIDCFNANTKIGIASPISSCSDAYFIPLEKGYSLENINNRLDNKHKISYPDILAAEGFCFCIRKQVIEQIGYLDEIYGKGYHEEIDFALRATTYGWKNVLIDNLYVYHARQASFGSEERKKLIQQNNKIFNERWEEYVDKRKKDLKNPIPKIYKDIFPIKSFFENIFSIKKIQNSIIIRFLFIKISKKIKN